MKRLATFKDKHQKIVANTSPREEKKLFTENSIVNVLVDRDQKNRRVLILNMGCKYINLIICLDILLYLRILQTNIVVRGILKEGLRLHHSYNIIIMA